MGGTGRDDSVQCLVSDFWKGYLTRRGFLAKEFAYILGVNKIKGATAGTVLRPIGVV